MTAITATRRTVTEMSSRVTLREGLRQTMTMAWRTIVQVRHNPSELGDYSIQPIMFVLMFTYVFGSAITGDTGSYLTFALPGIIVMNMLFITVYVGTGVNTDLTKGMSDRFRSLPIARWAPMAGRSIADQLKQAWSVVVLLAVGMILGFRFGTDVASVVAAVALLLLFALAFSWLSVFVGIMAKNPEKVQLYGFTVLFPFTFVSNVFVPSETMPGWLQAFVNVSPVTQLADAARALMVGDLTQGTEWHVASASGPVIWSLAWAAMIVTIFAPLSLWAFKRRA